MPAGRDPDPLHRPVAAAAGATAPGGGRGPRVRPDRRARYRRRDSAGILPRIFEPFFTTKEAGRGSGLGLATAYAVLQHHQGGITVESAPGAGAIFQIYPPPHPRRADHRARSALQLEPGQRHAARILLVDDEAAVRRPLRQALGLCGYTVVEARDGLEALRVARPPGTARCDLVVLDVKMPGMSGWDVLAELKRRDRACR